MAGEKRTANITSDDGMEIEDQDISSNEELLMSDGDNSEYKDDSDNDDKEKLNKTDSNEREEASSSVCLLQLIYDTRGSFPNTGETTAIFQTIESG